MNRARTVRRAYYLTITCEFLIYTYIHIYTHSYIMIIISLLLLLITLILIILMMTIIVSRARTGRRNRLILENILID